MSLARGGLSISGMADALRVDIILSASAFVKGWMIILSQKFSLKRTIHYLFIQQQNSQENSYITKTLSRWQYKWPNNILIRCIFSLIFNYLNMWNHSPLYVYTRFKLLCSLHVRIVTFWKRSDCKFETIRPTINFHSKRFFLLNVYIVGPQGEYKWKYKYKCKCKWKHVGN